jgi:hypothetical protein
MFLNFDLTRVQLNNLFVQSMFYFLVFDQKSVMTVTHHGHFQAGGPLSLTSHFRSSLAWPWVFITQIFFFSGDKLCSMEHFILQNTTDKVNVIWKTSQLCSVMKNFPTVHWEENSLLSHDHLVEMTLQFLSLWNPILPNASKTRTTSKAKPKRVCKLRRTSSE